MENLKITEMKHTYIKPSIEAVKLRPVSLLQESLGKGSESISEENKGMIQSLRNDFEVVE